MRPQSVTFRGKRWRVRYRQQRDSYGKCDHPSTRGKCITLDPTIAGQCRMYLAIHEALHASLWDLDEEAITTISTDMANWLWRLGLRWEDERAIDIGETAEEILRSKKQ